jgi:hypothetical protein
MPPQHVRMMRSVVRRAQLTLARRPTLNDRQAEICSVSQRPGRYRLRKNRPNPAERNIKGRPRRGKGAALPYRYIVDVDGATLELIDALDRHSIDYASYD